MSLEAIVFGLLIAMACVPAVAAVRHRWLGVVGTTVLVLLVAAPAATAWSVWKTGQLRDRLGALQWTCVPGTQLTPHIQVPGRLGLFLRRRHGLSPAGDQGQGHHQDEARNVKHVAPHSLDAIAVSTN